MPSVSMPDASSSARSSGQEEKKNKKKKEDPSVYVHGAAGALAGAATTAVLHPFDLIKTRMQVVDMAPSASASASAGRGSINRSLNVNYEGRKARHVLFDIVKSRGVQGLWQGVSPNVAGAMAAWGLYFLSYEELKGLLASRKARREHVPSSSSKENANNGDSAAKQRLTPGENSAAALGASVFTQLLTNPIWVLKTRMQLHSTNTSSNYEGVVSGLRQMWQQEGIRGWYKGIVPALFGTSHGMVQFAAYEELKLMLGTRSLRPRSMLDGRDTRLHLSDTDLLVASSVSKVVAVTITYPYQVVKSRLQERPEMSSVSEKQAASYKYQGVRDVVSRVWHSNGAGGFYAGIVPGILRVLPASVITLFAYERMVDFASARKSV